MHARGWGSKRSRQAKVGDWRRDKGGRLSNVQLEEQPGWLCRACGPWRALESLSRTEGEARKSEQPCDVLILTYVFKHIRLLSEE